MFARHTLVLSQVAFLVLLIGLWQWAVNAGFADSSFVGTPGGVASLLIQWITDGSLFGHMLSTLLVLVVGFAAGTALGLAFGAWMGTSAFAQKVAEPFLIFFNGMPRLILQPFFIIWLGFGFAPKVALVVAIIVVIVALNTASAFRDVNKDYLNHLRLAGARRSDLALQVYLPSLTLSLLATSRTNVAFAFQAALVSEFVGTTSGLGYLIVKGQHSFSADTIWASLAVVIVLSVIIDQALSIVERRTTSWMN